MITTFTPTPWDGQSELKLGTPIPSEIADRFIELDWRIEDDGQGHQTGIFSLGNLQAWTIQNGETSPQNLPAWQAYEP